MPRNTAEGSYYEFHRHQPGREIGRQIPRTQALHCVRSGGDVYTPLSSDAIALTKDVHKGKGHWDGAHETNFYPHYHPAGNHDNYGHVFYGQRGYRQNERRR